jgi:putative flippase GtrA
LFGALGVVGLGLTELLLYLLSGLLGAPVLLSKVVATAATFLWNFTSRKLLLFSPRPGQVPTAPAGAWPLSPAVPLVSEE